MWVRLENKQSSGRTLQLLFRAFTFGRMGQCDQVILVNLSGHGRMSGVRLVFGLCYPMFKVIRGNKEGGWTW